MLFTYSFPKRKWRHPSPFSDTVYIDLDDADNPIGMEVLRVDSSIFATLKALPDTATLRDLIRLPA